MKKEDHRIKITKLMIRKAYAELLKENKDQKISVKDLCEKADINRGTFYSHYKDVEDLQNQLIDQFKSMLEAAFVDFLSTVDIDQLSTKDFIKGILKGIYSNKDLCEILLYGGGSQEIVQEVLDVAKNLVSTFYTKMFENKTAEEINLWYSFVSGGAVFVIMNWIKNGFDTSIDKLSEDLNSLVLIASSSLNSEANN